MATSGLGVTGGPLPGGRQPQPVTNPLQDDRAAIAAGRRLFRLPSDPVV